MSTKLLKRRARGFTLIELLVVIAIIAVLVGLLLPAVQMAREASRRIQCSNNLKQIGLAMQNYHGSLNVFPPGYVSVVQSNGTELGPGFGWGVMVLKFMEQNPIYDATNFSLPILDPGSSTVRQAALATFLCPSSVGRGPVTVLNSAKSALGTDLSPSQYIACAGQLDVGASPATNNGVFYRNSATAIRSITDGTSSTFMAGERSRNVANSVWVGAVPLEVSCTQASWPVQDCEPSCVMILAATGPSPVGAPGIDTPNNKAAGADDFCSLHPGGCNFLFCDGSVRFIRDTINPQVYSNLATRGGGEVISGDAY